MNAYGPLWTLAGVIVTALATVLVARVNGRSSQQAALQTAVEPIRAKAEQEAYEAAAGYWKEQIAGLRDQVAALEMKVNMLVAQGETAERRNKSRIRQLEHTLIANGISVPNWEEANAP